MPIITQIGLGGALATGAAAQMAPTKSENLGIEEKLKKLKSLFDAGLINANEYDLKKSKLLEDF